MIIIIVTFVLNKILKIAYLDTIIKYQYKWEHWDLNPDRRVSSKVIAPVIHHYSDDPLVIIP